MVLACLGGLALGPLTSLGAASGPAPRAVQVALGPVGTVGSPLWGQQPYGLPTAREEMGAAWDPLSSNAFGIIFGGTGTCGRFCNDTWLFVDSPSVTYYDDSFGAAPSARDAVAMTWDTEDGYAVLFGGYNGTTLGDTWTWQRGLGWSEIHPSLSPSPRSSAAIVDDPHQSEVLLFGGRAANGSALGDTWTFRGGDWRPLTLSESPTPRWGASMAYDLSSGAVYLFGGTNGRIDFNDLWMFENDSWSEVSSGGPTAPSPRSDLLMEVTAGGQIVVSGGSSLNGSPLGQTWIYAHNSWYNETAGSGGPPALSGAAILAASDIEYNFYWVFGGAPFTSSQMSLWSLYIVGGGNPGNLQVGFTPSRTQGYVPLTVTFTAIVSGGTPPYQYLWNFGDGTPNSTLPQPTHVFYNVGDYRVTLVVRDSQGFSVQVQNFVTVLVPPSPPPPVTLATYLDSPLVAVVALGLLALFAIVVSVRIGLHRRKVRTQYLRQIAALGPPDRPGTFRNLERRPSTPSVGTGTPLSRRGLVRYAVRRALSGLGQLVLFLGLVYVVGVAVPEVMVPSIFPGPRDFLGYVAGFGTFCLKLLTGQWGFTAGSSKGQSIPVAPVVQIVSSYLPVSLEIGGLAFLLSLGLAYGIGLLAGWNPGRTADQSSRALTLLGLFFPVYLLILLLIPYLYIPWFNAFGAYPEGSLPPGSWFSQFMGGVPSWINAFGGTSPTHFPVLDAALHGAWRLDGLLWMNVLLAAAFTALGYLGIFLRYLRLATAEVRESTQTALLRSRGIPDRTLLWTHTGRRVLPVYVATFGQTFPVFLIVQASVEWSLNDRGLGSLLINYASNGFFVGYTSSSGTPVLNITTVLILLVAVIVLAVSAITDVVSLALDPQAVGTADRRVVRDGIDLPGGGTRGERGPRAIRTPRRDLPPWRGSAPFAEVAALSTPTTTINPLDRLQAAWQRWWSHRALAFGTILLLFFLAVAVGAALTYGPALWTISTNSALLIPSNPTMTLWPPALGPYPWGQTLGYGLSIYNGLIQGTPFDLLLIAAIVLPSATVGTLLGAYSATRGGRTDDVLMTITDAFLSVPAFLLATILLFALFIPPNAVTPLDIYPPTARPWLLIIATTVVLWAPYARVVRAQARTVVGESYIEAARASGASRRRLLFRHILPNSFTPALSQVPITVSTVLFFMVLLSYARILFGVPTNILGFMVPAFIPAPSFPEWTWVLANGMLGWNPPNSGVDLWWAYMIPGLWILAFGVAVTLFCDGLRDFLSPFARP